MRIIIIIIIITGRNKYSGKWSQGGLDTLSSTGNKENCNNLTTVTTYLQIPYIEGTGEVSIFCGAIIGSCLGFLWFNAPPAKIFMGDTGSLSLGGSLGAVGIITKHEIVLAITGGLFVLEAISVIVQVFSYKFVDCICI